ncbi:MAG: tetratricopeptide repeat protein [Gammaproteobacteria bacterium]|nr:tetratricopeptide repeat protein [Gammaproteobacteria bacterium]NNJ96379.1 tetratricopeptide repeat protein [Gammaproteobacteria bacterium]
MEEFESEDQQVEAIKKWWKENGASLVLGLGIGIAALLGWREYLAYQTEHSAEASDLFEAVQTQIANEMLDATHISKADLIRNEYEDTPYAALVSLLQASHEYDSGNTESALTHLRWAIENSSETDVKYVASLRLARLLIAEQQYDQAEAILLADHPAGFNVGYEELKGDLYVAKGEIAMARVAYDKAINAAAGGASRWLRLKRQDLGSADLENS